MLTIALGSQSRVKQIAVSNALHQFRVVDVQLVAVHASSLVAEQPFNDEILLGAENRAAHAAILVPDATFAIAIENGIYSRQGRYFDVALVVARLQSGEFVRVESDSVEFPADAVQETICRGVNVWTVGKVLQEWGRVQSHDDPHRTLTGKARLEFLHDAALHLFQELRVRRVL